MGFKKITFLSVFIISIIAVSFVAFAEEAPITEEDSTGVISDQQSAPAQEKNDTQWAWGEVVNLDNQAKTFTIKYLDYEADQEKELVLEVDDKTNFENIKGLDELKLKDTLSIDYTTGPDNKSIAKNISLEKTDVLPSAPEQTKEEDKPVEVPIPAGAPVSVNAAATPNPDLAVVSEPVPAPVFNPVPPPAQAVVSEPVQAQAVVSEPVQAQAVVSEPASEVRSQAQ